jgi:hypothetical protein
MKSNLSGCPVTGITFWRNCRPDIYFKTIIYLNIKQNDMSKVKVNEFRVDSIILYKKYGEGDGKIGQMKRGDFGRFNNEEYEPVAITHEWLAVLGFSQKLDVYGWYTVKAGEWIIDVEIVGENKYVHIYKTPKAEGIRMSGETAPCKYVHQLQNIYFMLTGKEITDVMQIAF